MLNVSHNLSLEKYFLGINADKHSDVSNFKAFVSYSLGIIKSIKPPKLKVIASESRMSVLNISEFINDDLDLLDSESILDEEIKKLDNLSDAILDSFVILKENNRKTNTRNVYCSSQKRGVKGLEYLVLISVKGNNTKVIGIKRLISKPNLITESINLIDKILKYKSINSVKADNHFFHDILINYLNSKNITFISKPKKSGIWSKIALKNCFNHIDLTGFRYHNGIYTRDLILNHKLYGICKIVKVKPSYRAEEKKCFYIVSTNINLSVMDIVKGKKQRWKIETVFRDCSQNLGLRSCQCTNDKTIDNHVLMSFLTYNFLSEIKKIFNHKNKTIGYIKRTIQASIYATTNVFDLIEQKSA